MSVGVEYAMGYEIRWRTKSIMMDPPPSISLHRLGGEASTYFTPEEARRFGEAMIRAAQAAEETLR